MKKILSLILAATTLLSMAVPAMATEETVVTETVFEVTAPVETQEADVTAQPTNELATSGQCGEAIFWSFDADSATLTISGSGDMYAVTENWDDFDQGVYAYEPGWWSLPVRHVVVEEGVENLSNYAFAQSAKGNEGVLETVQLPTTLQAIPEYGFIVSTVMTSLQIPEGIKSLTGWPFGDPEDSFLVLTDLYLPVSLEELDIMTVFFSGYDVVAGQHKLENIHYAGTQAQWKQVSRIRSEVMGTLFGASETDYAGFGSTFDSVNVICSDTTPEFEFDDLLVVAFFSDVERIEAAPVTYVEGSEPVYPVLTVYYKDTTTGSVPSYIQVTYPTQWPTTPGTYELEVILEDDYTVPFQVTVQPAEGHEHTIVNHEPKAPTCTEPGWNAYETCENCNYTTYEEILATGHSYTPNVVEPTLTGEGYTEYTCVCGDSYKADYVDALELVAPAVTIVWDEATGKQVLTWDDLGEGVVYDVYRAKKKSGSYSKVGTNVEESTWTDAGAGVGTTYYYKVQSVFQGDAELRSAYSNVVSGAAKCAQPAAKVSVNSSGKPVVSWSKISKASKYQIDYSTDGVKFSKLTTTTKTSYTHTKATAGKTYTYRVRALGSKSACNSAYSEVVTENCYLARPTLTVSVDAGSGAPYLSWSKVSGAKSYIVIRDPGENEEVLLQQTGRTYLDLEVSVGGTYRYAVVALAKDENIRSQYSDVKSATAKCARPDVQATTTPDGDPQLSWRGVYGADEYVIYRSTKSSKTGDQIQITTETQFVDYSASSGKTYYYRVKAICSDTKLNSANSERVTVAVKCARPEVTVKAGSSGKPELTWNKVSGAKKYEIRYSTDGGATWAKKTITTTKTKYTHTGATGGKEYTYQVRALGSGKSYHGSYSSPAVSCYVTCAAPSVTAAVDKATGYPSLTWKKVTGATGYAIYRTVDGVEEAEPIVVTGTGYKDENVTVDSKYSYQVVALGSIAEFDSARSKAVSVTAACARPATTVTYSDAGKPVISWEPVDGAVSYEVYRSTKSGRSYKVLKDGKVTDTSYTDSSVGVGKTYYYKVIAVSEDGKKSDYSAYKKATGKCAAPVISVGYNQDSGKPVVTWNKVSGAKKYEIYRSDAKDGTYERIGTATNPKKGDPAYTDKTAAVGTFYYYRVRTIGSKSSYNSAYSNASGCLTVCAKPVVTGKQDAETGMPYLSWKAVDGAVMYEISRALRGGELTRIAVTSDTYYLDQDESIAIGNAYRYQVKALAANALSCSGASEPVLIPVACEETILSVTLGEGDKPLLSWDAVEGAQVYAIYRSTSKSGTYKLHQQNNAEEHPCSYLDTRAKKGKKYYYYVVVEAQDTASPKSNVVNITSKG